ncbi:acyltransferase family protein [Fulvivirga sediminis]|uniref:DUF1624 domain-containing protein n=1 Tax=Fulvivirga sediminis TaxID=2803949 RepID=A0A937F5P3_9BACT|nr:heparan-alpha-glucosaminide N-acetyltransferase domain-containing protein [Fulvivirga sediminis]MBL3656897.1 DUF1624 domain-containing protein [Fulvivirga sediminis]
MTKPDRLLSLDVFRGITIVAMLIVNDPGSWSYIYSPLEHASWHGCTPTDLVFPFFLFIVGVSVSLSLKKVRYEKQHHSSRIGHIIKRSIILFGIGLFLNAFPFFHLESIRIPGVLQRIAIVFLVCAVLFLKTSWKSQVIISIIVLLLYWLLMAVLPMSYNQNLLPGDNLAAHIDAYFLSGHMWSSTKTWDPEGLMSTFPAIVTGIIGMLAGQWLQLKQSKETMVIGLFVVGNVLIVLGLFWDMAFPINKSLWTSSYVLYSGGIALNFLAILYWLLDVKRWRGKGWLIFKAFGVNAIFAYIFGVLLSYGFGYTIQVPFFRWLKTITGNPELSSLIYALFFVGVTFIPVWVLYKRRIFLKV